MTPTPENNPFSITFGKEPAEEIARENILEEIISGFSAPIPSGQVVLLTGVRGSGKSSLTARLMKLFGKQKGWFVTDLNIESSMLNVLSAKLGALSGYRKLFKEAELSVPLFGGGIKLSKADSEAGCEAELDRMLSSLTKKKKRLLITIDDVASTREMRVFSHFFQSCLMKDYNVYLIMNGVYDNIENLQNEKTLTFLQRAPKIPLQPLNRTAVANMYGRIFKFPESTIREMASLSAGYAYAVQALGYIVWKHCREEKNADLKTILDSYDLLLAEGVYDKLWTDMSETDREICRLVADGESDGNSVAEIINQVGISKSLASNYKRRLIKKGIMENIRGRFVFSLPRFGKYVSEQYRF